MPLVSLTSRHGGSGDRSDVEFLTRKGALDRRLLEERFEAELRPYVLNEAREQTTLRLWLDEFFETNKP